jgi:hypothetical protein
MNNLYYILGSKKIIYNTIRMRMRNRLRANTGLFLVINNETQFDLILIE